MRGSGQTPSLTFGRTTTVRQPLRSAADHQTKGQKISFILQSPFFTLSNCTSIFSPPRGSPPFLLSPRVISHQYHQSRCISPCCLAVISHGCQMRPYPIMPEALLSDHIGSGCEGTVCVSVCVWVCVCLRVCVCCE